MGELMNFVNGAVERSAAKQDAKFIRNKALTDAC